jgi:allophanate hydrolase
MTPALRILAPGVQTTVQDLGRPGYRSQGVPLAGVLDREALRLVNALLGNDPGEAALEIRLTGPRLQAEGAPVRLALDGALSGLLIEGDQTRPIAPWSTVTLGPGAILEVRPEGGALSGLIGLGGGLALDPVLGSRSTYVRAAIGGLEGRPLAAGDLLPLRAAAPPGPDRRLATPWTREDGPIRLLPGPQAHHFTEDGLALLYASDYEATRDMDRMGLRLSGPAIAHDPAHGAEVPSEGMAPGCLQVPASGQPLVVLADGQTVGGYAKPGVVISVDLPRLAALRPGDRVRFAPVTLAEAEALVDQREERLAKAIAGIVDQRPPGGRDLDALYRENLIGGVVDMAHPDHFPGHLETEEQCA